MEFKYQYAKKSSAEGNANSMAFSFAPDTLRPPTFFVGEIEQKITFREAISALHDVVVSDMRFKPKDRTEYLQWLEGQEQSLLAELYAGDLELAEQIKEERAKLSELNKQRSEILGPFHKARSRYFNYLWENDRDAWYVLDPVITVHPDQIFFECFSEDESTYGKLSCNFDAFKSVSEKSFGTTNIDYSEGLYNEFQKIRSYRETKLIIDPEGFSIQSSGEEEFDERKIELPESWVRGFLQVSSAMTMPMTELTLHPMDIHNICHLLRRKKEKVGPRSMRFELIPDKPIKILFEPWNDELICARSIYRGVNPVSIRTWGRRRLHILERLIPIADSFTVYLLGDGMPSFYIADLGDMNFTLGLSGWSANDWSRMGNFDLLSPRESVDAFTLKKVMAGLQENWQESSESLAERLELDESIVKSALAICSQNGHVLYDISSHVYRIRELSREPLPMQNLMFSNDREKAASELLKLDCVQVTHQAVFGSGIIKRGTVIDKGKSLNVEVAIDGDNRLHQARCECHFYHQNKLRKGPCEHMLALRAKES